MKFLASRLLLATSALAMPSGNVTELFARGGGTPSSTGTSNGYYYSFWTDGGAQITDTNEATGEYKAPCRNVGRAHWRRLHLCQRWPWHGPYGAERRTL